MELKQNKGVIFKNAKKTSDKHPDYRGEIDVNGQRWEISLWVNESKEGKKYFSASISEPYVKNEAPVIPPKIEDQGDDMPF